MPAAALAVLLAFLLEAVVVVLRLVLPARVLPARGPANDALARAVGVRGTGVDDDVLEVGEYEIAPRTAVDLVGLAFARATYGFRRGKIVLRVAESYTPQDERA